MIYALIGIAAAFCACIQWGDEIPVPHGNVNKKKQSTNLKLPSRKKRKNLNVKSLKKILLAI